MTDPISRNVAETSSIAGITDANPQHARPLSLRIFAPVPVPEAINTTRGTFCSAGQKRSGGHRAMTDHRDLAPPLPGVLRSYEHRIQESSVPNRACVPVRDVVPVAGFTDARALNPHIESSSGKVFGKRLVVALRHAVAEFATSTPRRTDV